MWQQRRRTTLLQQLRSLLVLLLFASFRSINIKSPSTIFAVAQTAHHPNMNLPSDDYSCGLSWFKAANECLKHCPTGLDNECSSLGDGFGCFYFTGCKEAFDRKEAEKEELDANNSQGDDVGKDVDEGGTPDQNQFCGSTFIQAMMQCSQNCIDDNECGEGESCWGDTNCNHELEDLESDVVFTLRGSSGVMPDEVVDIFQRSIFDMLQGIANDLKIHLVGLEVTAQRYFSDEEIIEANVAIVAQYRPPPRRNLEAIVKNGINLNKHEVKNALKQAAGAERVWFFVNLDEISVTGSDDAMSDMGTGRPTLSPTTTPSMLPSAPPSVSPSATPSDIPSSTPSRTHIQKVVTASSSELNSSTEAGFGILFNARTPVDAPVVLVTGLSFYTDMYGKFVGYELWTKLGSFEEFKGGYQAWQLIASGVTEGKGLVMMTDIPSDTFTQVSIPGGGGERAFYLTLNEMKLYSGSGSSDAGEVFASSPDLEIYGGESVLSYPFPEESYLYRSPRKFLGAVQYDRLPCEPFSLFGRVNELPCPVVPTASPTRTAAPTYPKPTNPPTRSPETASPTKTPSTGVPTTAGYIAPSFSPSMSVPPSTFVAYSAVNNVTESPMVASPMKEGTSSIQVTSEDMAPVDNRIIIWILLAVLLSIAGALFCYYVMYFRQKRSGKRDSDDTVSRNPDLDEHVLSKLNSKQRIRLDLSETDVDVSVSERSDNEPARRVGLTKSLTATSLTTDRSNYIQARAQMARSMPPSQRCELSGHDFRSSTRLSLSEVGLSKSNSKRGGNSLSMLKSRPGRDIDWKSSQMRRKSLEEDDIESGRRHNPSQQDIDWRSSMRSSVRGSDRPVNLRVSLQRPDVLRHSLRHSVRNKDSRDGLRSSLLTPNNLNALHGSFRDYNRRARNLQKSDNANKHDADASARSDNRPRSVGLAKIALSKSLTTDETKFRELCERKARSLSPNKRLELSRYDSGSPTMLRRSRSPKMRRKRPEEDDIKSRRQHNPSHHRDIDLMRSSVRGNDDRPVNSRASLERSDSAGKSNLRHSVRHSVRRKDSRDGLRSSLQTPKNLNDLQGSFRDYNRRIGSEKARTPQKSNKYYRADTYPPQNIGSMLDSMNRGSSRGRLRASLQRTGDLLWADVDVTNPMRNSLRRKDSGGSGISNLRRTGSQSLRASGTSNLKASFTQNDEIQRIRRGRGDDQAGLTGSGTNRSSELQSFAMKRNGSDKSLRRSSDKTLLTKNLGNPSTTAAQGSNSNNLRASTSKSKVDQLARSRSPHKDASDRCSIRSTSLTRSNRDESKLRSSTSMAVKKDDEFATTPVIRPSTEREKRRDSDNTGAAQCPDI